MTATVHHPAIHRHHPAVRRHHAAIRRHRDQRRPNYALRRLVAAVCALLAVVLAAQVLVGAAGALAGLDSRPAAASQTVPTTGDVLVRTVPVAEPGDTLWSIADRYRGEVDRGRFVDRLVDLNGGASIQVGQAVRLP